MHYKLRQAIGPIGENYLPENWEENLWREKSDDVKYVQMGSVSWRNVLAQISFIVIGDENSDHLMVSLTWGSLIPKGNFIFLDKRTATENLKQIVARTIHRFKFWLVVMSCKS